MTLTKNKIIESVIEMLGKHPFISTFMVCLILTPFCYGSNFNISGEAIFILAIIFATVHLFAHDILFQY